MGYHKRESVIEAFLNSEYKRMELDWYAMGYSSPTSCRSSIANVILKMGYQCFCEQRKNKVFLLKPSAYGRYADLNQNESPPVFSNQMMVVTAHVKTLIEKFIESDLWVYQILWGRLGYVSVDSCYTSYRHSIRFYGHADRIFVVKQGEELFLVRRPEPPTDETKLEEYWDEEITV